MSVSPPACLKDRGVEGGGGRTWVFPVLGEPGWLVAASLTTWCDSWKELPKPPLLVYQEQRPSPGQTDDRGLVLPEAGAAGACLTWGF